MQTLRPSPAGSPIQRLRSAFESSGRKKPGMLLLVQLVVLLLGAVDYATGVKFQFAIVYLAPISFAALRGGLLCGVVTSATSTAVWIVAEKYGGAEFGNGWVAWWNALER